MSAGAIFATAAITSQDDFALGGSNQPKAIFGQEDLKGGSWPY